MFLFFVLLFLAALTSLISIYEATVNLMMDKFSLSRMKATFISTLSSAFGVVLVLLSSTGKNGLLKELDLFNFFDKVTGSYLMPLMVFICCLFMGWKIFDILIINIGQGSGHQSKIFKTYLKWVLRFISPIVVFILFLATVLSV